MTTGADASRMAVTGVTIDAWGLPPVHPVIGREDVHVWSASLRLGAAAIAALRDTLAPDERARADRFHFRRHREEFTAARGLLRAILARYLALAPERVRFDYRAHGKPALAQDLDAGSGLRFNLSHAGGVALYAIARDREIGVDVERIRPDAATLDIAERFFAPAEVAALRRVPDVHRAEAFFNCWTRKEAYVKAMGTGLSHSLRDFAVSVGPEAAVLHGEAPEPSEPWTLVSLAPRSGYVGAVATAGRVHALHAWRAPGWDAARGPADPE